MAGKGQQLESVGRWNLVTGEDTYSGQFAQNPATSRRLLSLIPSLNGELNREAGETLLNNNALNGPAGALFFYKFNDASGNAQSLFFAASSTSLYSGGDLGNWTLRTLPTSLGGTTTNPFSNKYPSFAVINNLLHISDGVKNWIYDGPNDQFVLDGFPIPLVKPDYDATAAGSFSCTVGVFYWFTYADETSGRVHESSSSPISDPSTGALTNKTIRVFPTIKEGCNTTLGSTTVTNSSSGGFGPQYIGLHLWVAGVDYGVITAVPSSTQLTLATPAPATNTGTPFLVVPVRTTHIHIYRSESDGSKLGKFLGKIQVAGNATPYLDDQSPFENQPGSTLLDIDRPIRNDPAPASLLMEVHKYRLWRRRENIPNRFNYTAFEEVLSGANGSPQESVPGADVNTLSDIIDETAFPTPATTIRALQSHSDALYLGTESEIIPLWGDTIGQFALSQVTTIDGGVISRFGMQSTSHGLIVFSYDRKLYLYPPISPVWALTPQDLNVTDQLVEIGRPMRNKFLQIKSSDLDNVRVVKYKYNTRDWVMVCYQDNQSVYHTFVYDFETKGWFELQRGFVSLAVFEVSPGIKVLVGGGTDGFVRVVDDVTGFFAPNTTFPTALFRTALIDFGNPSSLHEPQFLEVEVSNPALMDSTTTVNFYLDPTDADNPGDPIELQMSQVQGFPNRYRGWFSASAGGGVVCKRLMVELNLTSDTEGGKFQGIFLQARPLSNLAI